MRGIYVLLLVGAIPASIAMRAADAGAADEDEAVLTAAKVPIDGPALIDFFRRHTQSSAAADKLQMLVKQLGDDSFEAREKATAELTALGPAALPVLREAVKSRDPEIVDRARRCLRQIDTGHHATERVAVAAARLLARKRPAGGAEALLNYVASHADDFGVDELRAALAALALGADGKPEPAVVVALSDKEPARRLAAGIALAHTSRRELRPAVRKLLSDPEKGVCFEMALSLIPSWEPEAVPVLLDALVDPAAGRSGRAEDGLRSVAGVLAPKTRRGATTAERERCRDAWTAWWRGTEGPPLLKRFHEHLEKKEPDGTDATIALARLLGFRKPDGAVTALLDAASGIDNAEVVETIHAALAEIIAASETTDAALISALTDMRPGVRAAAGDALCRAGRLAQTPGVKALLQDKEPLVRLHTALGLAAAGDKDAVPVLIALLSDLPLEQAWRSEDALVRLAGRALAGATLTKDVAERAKARDAWAVWWKEHAAMADLKPLRGAPRMLGWTTLVLLDAGRVQEVDGGGHVQWKFDGLQLPLDFQLLPGERVLVAEHNGNRVTERNRLGDVLWFFDCSQLLPGPQVAQRLPNGNTFIASRERVIEVDRDGKVVFTFEPTAELIMRAHRLPSGEMVGVLSTNQPRFVRLDPAGKELSAFVVSVHTFGGRIEMLPGGGALVPNHSANAVVEHDRGGVAVRVLRIDSPVAAVRLRNGNTLATSMPRDVSALATLPYRAVEIDRDGKEVWEFKADTKVTRALRR